MESKEKELIMSLQDNRICLYYVTERLIDLTKIKTEKE